MANHKMDIATMHDGTSIRVERYEPNDAPIGVIQMVHGLGEHIGSYDGLGELFARSGFAFVMHEQRGFGEMPGLTDRQRKSARGVAPGYDYFLEDIAAIRERIDVWYPGLPVILFGHSMGGNIALNYLLKYQQERYVKAIMECPWLRLHKPLPPLVTAVARLLGKISGNLTVSANLNVNHITRNRAEADRLKGDKLFHDLISFRLYAAITEAGEYAIKNAARIKLPTLLLCAGDDKILSAAAIHECARNAGKNFTLIDYPDGYHCLHLDIISDEVASTILEFCKKEL